MVASPYFYLYLLHRDLAYDGRTLTVLLILFEGWKIRSIIISVCKDIFFRKNFFFKSKFLTLSLSNQLCRYTMRIADITVPYAIADFAELREGGYFYVDKTQYIPLLERYKAPVFLRPRRFGQ